MDRTDERRPRQPGRRPKKKNYKYYKMKIRVFGASIFIMAVIALILPLRPKESEVEKRTLATFPSFSLSTFLNGEFFTGVDTWYSDTFPFRELLISGNNKYRSLYGFGSTTLHGTIQEADAIPTEKFDMTMIISDCGKAYFDDLENKMKEKMQAQQDEANAIDNASGGKKRREIEAVPEQVGSIYISGDTAFQLYYFATGPVDRYVNALNRLANKVDDSVNIYDIVVPISTGIYLDQKLQDELGCSNQQEAIDYVYASLDERVKTVDLFDTFKAHSDEYLYFRTDHHWTALGAYYTYCEYMNVKGESPTLLSEFETMTFDDFLGTYYASSEQNAALGSNPDTVVAYIPKATNEMTFVDSDGNEQQWKVIQDVTDWASSGKYNCFIGGDNPFSTIENPTLSDGSSCLVVKESFGNAFVPFLVDDYQTVYVVDYRYYPEGITSLIREKGIQDVIFLNNISAVSTDSLVKNIEEIVDY